MLSVHIEVRRGLGSGEEAKRDTIRHFVCSVSHDRAFSAQKCCANRANEHNMLRCASLTPRTREQKKCWQMLVAKFDRFVLHMLCQHVAFV